MITTLKKTGNSRSLVVSPSILKLLKIEDDTKLEISTDGVSLQIKPVQKDENTAVFKAFAKVNEQYSETFKALADR